MCPHINYLTFATTLGSGPCYYPHFIDEETYLERLRILSEITQVVSVRAGMPTQAV